MYYPLSQIITNIYANPGELEYKSSRKPYTGYYWKNSKGQLYSGKTPQDLPTEELIQVTNLLENTTESSILNTSIYYNLSVENSQYINLTNPSSPGFLPYYSPTLPTQQDYQIGEMRRYFCKKTNENIYLEINNNTYIKILGKDPTIAYQYYIPFNIPWQLTGTKEQAFTTNKNIVELTMKQQKLPMFDAYIKKDYLKYYQ
jgi:hypothetical protein